MFFGDGSCSKNSGFREPIKGPVVDSKNTSISLVGTGV